MMRIKRISGGNFDFEETESNTPISLADAEKIRKGYEQAGKGKKLIKCATELCSGIFTAKCDSCLKHFCSKHFEDHNCHREINYEKNSSYSPSKKQTERLTADEKIAIRKAYEELHPKKELNESKEEQLVSTQPVIKQKGFLDKIIELLLARK